MTGSVWLKKAIASGKHRVKAEAIAPTSLEVNFYLAKPPGSDGLLEMVQAVWLYWLVLNRPPQTEMS